MKVKPSRNAGKVVMELDRNDEPLLAASAISPFHLKKILVPVDFSECSRKALLYALPLAELHGAAITLLYVVPNPYAVGEYGGIDYMAIERDLIANGRKELDLLTRDYAKGKIKVEGAVRAGSAGTEILEAAKEMAVGLIVISTHGHTGLKHVFLGSVAEHVIRHAPCPVLVVREHEHDFLAD